MPELAAERLLSGYNQKAKQGDDLGLELFGEISEVGYSCYRILMQGLVEATHTTCQCNGEYSRPIWKAYVTHEVCAQAASPEVGVLVPKQTLPLKHISTNMIFKISTYLLSLYVYPICKHMVVHTIQIPATEQTGIVSLTNIYQIWTAFGLRVKHARRWVR